jgi:hypothetical protein
MNGARTKPKVIRPRRITEPVVHAIELTAGTRQEAARLLHAEWELLDLHVISLDGGAL